VTPSQYPAKLQKTLTANTPSREICDLSVSSAESNFYRGGLRVSKIIGEQFPQDRDSAVVEPADDGIALGCSASVNVIAEIRPASINLERFDPCDVRSTEFPITIISVHSPHHLVPCQNSMQGLWAGVLWLS
jgi:hypothetical protein